MSKIVTMLIAGLFVAGNAGCTNHHRPVGAREEPGRRHSGDTGQTRHAFGHPGNPGQAVDRLAGCRDEEG